MEWAAEEPSHVDKLIEFEARVNAVWQRNDDAVICVYDLAKFGGDTVIDIVRTHPMIIIGGLLQRNPFFTPPEDFLTELRARRALRRNMKSSVEQTDEQIRRLQRCMSDLVSLLSLPAMWAGGDPVLVVRTMLEALVSMLSLDFLYVCSGHLSETPIEMTQFGGPNVGRPGTRHR